MRLALFALAIACSSSTAPEPSGAKPEPPPPEKPGAPPLLATVDLPQADPDGSDGADDGSPAVLPEPLRALARDGSGGFVELGPAPATRHPIVCDLIEHRGALYASHAVDPINRTGSRIHRWRGGRWELAFDYDGRRGWGGGQGLSRIRSIAGRLVAVDSDSTSAGFFGISESFVEAYLFVSDPGGEFPPVGEAAPPGTVAMANSLHSFDAITYRGKLVVTGGTGLRGGERNLWPGALWVASLGEPIARPRFALGAGAGVVRSTFLHRFGGRLYVGFQNNEARARFDLAVLTGDPSAAATPEPVLARVTERGGWLTRRFASGGGELFWIASGYRRQRDRPARLWRSVDGRSFDAEALPRAAGAPQDLIAGRDARLLLTTTGLWAAWRGRPGWRLVAASPPGDPFGRFSTFCSAPLALFGDAVVAGSTRDGRVFAVKP